MSEKIKVLYPIDFSEHSVKAYKTALYLAKLYDAEMFLINVMEPPAGPLKLISGFNKDEARKAVVSAMDDFLAENGDEEIVYHKLIKVGKPWKKIVEAAHELNANIIVMGTHGASGVSELLAGTNAARVIRTAPCPVITLRNEPAELGFNKILLPLDLTKETGEKLELGIEFAQVFKAELVVLSVLESNDEDAKKRLQKRMAMAVNHIRKHGVNVDSTMLLSKGNIADLVVEYGAEINADLICIMTQQELDFRETFMGSNAAHVVNHSHIPVLSIKPKREYKSASFAASHFG